MHYIKKILVLMNLYLINQLKWRESLPILKNESIQCQKLVFLHVGLGKTKELDVSFKSEAALNLELYKELVHYLRGSSVVAIEK